MSHFDVDPSLTKEAPALSERTLETPEEWQEEYKEVQRLKASLDTTADFEERGRIREAWRVRAAALDRAGFEMETPIKKELRDILRKVDHHFTEIKGELPVPTGVAPAELRKHLSLDRVGSAVREHFSPTDLERVAGDYGKMQELFLGRSFDCPIQLQAYTVLGEGGVEPVIAFEALLASLTYVDGSSEAGQLIEADLKNKFGQGKGIAPEIRQYLLAAFEEMRASKREAEHLQQRVVEYVALLKTDPVEALRVYLTDLPEDDSPQGYANRQFKDNVPRRLREEGLSYQEAESMGSAITHFMKGLLEQRWKESPEKALETLHAVPNKFGGKVTLSYYMMRKLTGVCMEEEGDHSDDIDRIFERMKQKLLGQYPEILVLGTQYQSHNRFVWTDSQRREYLDQAMQQGQEDLLDTLIDSDTILLFRSSHLDRLNDDQLKRLGDRLVFLQKDRGYSFSLESLRRLPTEYMAPVLEKSALQDMREYATKSFSKEELQRCPWIEMMQRLTSIQGIGQHIEHDPWKNELQPLMDEARRVDYGEEKMLRLESAEDAQLFYDFVQEFGAVNAQSFFQCYIYLRKEPILQKEQATTDTGSFVERSSLPIPIKNLLQEAFGVRLHKMKDAAAILNELRQFKRRILSESLQDKLSRDLDSSLGKEMFKAIIGSTRWKREGEKDFIDLYKETSATSPEKVRLAEGYRAKTIKVPLLAESKSEAPGFDEKAYKMPAGVAEAVRFYESSFQFTRSSEQPERRNVAILQIFDQELGALNGALEKVRAKLRTAKEQHMEGIRLSMTKTMEQIELVEAERVRFAQDPLDSEEALLEAMERCAGYAKTVPLFDAVVRRLSSIHIGSVLDKGTFAGWKGVLDEALQVEAPTSRKLEQLSSFLRDWMGEHYLNPQQQVHQTGHSPFSDALIERLGLAWQMKNKDPLMQRIQREATDIQEQRTGKRTVSKKMMTLDFVPVKGIMRVVSGDIADACFTSQHEALAKGEFEETTAVIMVKNRGKANETLVGSFLLIEGEKPEGGRALVVRANNPRQNLLNEVDVTALVKEVARYAGEVAEARAIPQIGTILDKATQSCSNRLQVEVANKTLFQGGQPIPLKSTPDTNFNSYPIWNAGGAHPVSEISLEALKAENLV